MAKKLTPDRFIVVVNTDGEGVLKCCECGLEAEPVAKLGMVWTVSDQLMYIDTHAWAHGVSEKRGVPVSAFGR